MDAWPGGPAGARPGPRAARPRRRRSCRRSRDRPGPAEAAVVRRRQGEGHHPFRGPRDGDRRGLTTSPGVWDGGRGEHQTRCQTRGGPSVAARLGGSMTTPDNPLGDDEMTTEGVDPTGVAAGPGTDADGTDADGTDADSTDADGTDGTDADGTDGTDADGTDGTDGTAF